MSLSRNAREWCMHSCVLCVRGVSVVICSCIVLRIVFYFRHGRVFICASMRVSSAAKATWRAQKKVHHEGATPPRRCIPPRGCSTTRVFPHEGGCSTTRVFRHEGAKFRDLAPIPPKGHLVPRGCHQAKRGGAFGHQAATPSLRTKSRHRPAPKLARTPATRLPCHGTKPRIRSQRRPRRKAARRSLEPPTCSARW